MNLDTLKSDLWSWLEGLSYDMVVGRRNEPDRCVLSNFLTGTGAVVTVRKGRAGDLRLPKWACTFYEAMDICLGRKTGDYTAATALAVLAKV